MKLILAIAVLAARFFPGISAEEDKCEQDIVCLWSTPEESKVKWKVEKEGGLIILKTGECEYPITCGRALLDSPKYSASKTPRAFRFLYKLHGDDRVFLRLYLVPLPQGNEGRGSPRLLVQRWADWGRPFPRYWTEQNVVIPAVTNSEFYHLRFEAEVPYAGVFVGLRDLTPLDSAEEPSELLSTTTTQAFEEERDPKVSQLMTTASSGERPRQPTTSSRTTTQQPLDSGLPRSRDTSTLTTTDLTGATPNSPLNVTYKSISEPSLDALIPQGLANEAVITVDSKEQDDLAPGRGTSQESFFEDLVYTKVFTPILCGEL